MTKQTTVVVIGSLRVKLSFIAGNLIPDLWFSFLKGNTMLFIVLSFLLFLFLLLSQMLVLSNSYMTVD